MEWAAVSANFLHLVSGQIKASKVRVQEARRASHLSGSKRDALDFDSLVPTLFW